MDTPWALFGAFILTIIVIQIERQIILSSKNWGLFFFRFLIGLVMAFIGAVIVDQFIFKEDIDIRKEQEVDEKVNKFLPIRLAGLNEEIARLDSLIEVKDKEKEDILLEVTNNPNIEMPSRKIIYRPGKYFIEQEDSSGNVKSVERDTTYKESTYEMNSMANPKMSLIDGVDETINQYTEKRNQYITERLNLRQESVEELKSKSGFLDELETMYHIMQDSMIAIVVWSLWFLFFLGLELFILVSKIGEHKKEDTDYNYIVECQKKAYIKRAEVLYVSSKPKTLID
jgi:hypothetical protein